MHVGLYLVEKPLGEGTQTQSLSFGEGVSWQGFCSRGDVHTGLCQGLSVIAAQQTVSHGLECPRGLERTPRQAVAGDNGRGTEPRVLQC